MKRTILFLCLISSLLLSSCVSTRSHEVEMVYRHHLDKYSFRVINNAFIPDKAIEIFERKLRNKLIKADMYQEDSPRQLEVNFTKYDRRHFFWGMFVGFFVGIETVYSTTTIREVRSGQEDGKFEVRTRINSPKSSHYLVFKDQADEIVVQVKDQSLK